MAIVKVNGRELDASCVTFIWGSTPIPFTEISFDQTLEREFGRRAGQQHIQGYTRGQYTPSAVKLKMYVSDYESIIVPLLPANGYGNAQKDGLLRIEDPDGSMGNTTRKFDKLSISKESETHTQGPAGLVMDIEMTTTQISRNGKTINTVPGNPATGAAAKLRV